MILAGDGRPFAAVQGKLPYPSPVDYSARTVAPASSYHLTGNTTEFTIEAPEAGFALLTETFEDGNFQVTIDGEPATCFRANHAFKAVRIPKAGRSTIRFSYWPRLLTPALWLSAIGLLLALASAAVCLQRECRTKRFAH